jgi:hypothetical protein
VIDPEPWQPAWELDERRRDIRRVPELDALTEAHEFAGWRQFLRELDNLSDAGLWHDLDEVEEQFGPDGSGWVEDGHGGAELIWLTSASRGPVTAWMAGPLVLSAAGHFHCLGTK